MHFTNTTNCFGSIAVCEQNHLATFMTVTHQGERLSSNAALYTYCTRRSSVFVPQEDPSLL